MENPMELNEVFTMESLDANDYVIIVEGWSSSSGRYTVEVHCGDDVFPDISSTDSSEFPEMSSTEYPSTSALFPKMDMSSTTASFPEMDETSTTDIFYDDAFCKAVYNISTGLPLVPINTCVQCQY